MIRAVLFDLDDTLIVEEAAAQAAFLATAGMAAASWPDLDAQQLALDARARARELWYAGPSHAYCERMSISSWEGLWCRYEHDAPEMAELARWAPTYRREAWAAALRDQGVDDADLATTLGERFGHERRVRHEAFPDTRAVLDALAGRYRLGLITNGAPCLQGEKVEASGLAARFDVVVLAGTHGTAKPDPIVFTAALDALDIPPQHAVMVGDNLERDVQGAQAAGLDAVWLNRQRRPITPDRTPCRAITTLAELPAVLTELSIGADR